MTSPSNALASLSHGLLRRHVPFHRVGKKEGREQREKRRDRNESRQAERAIHQTLPPARMALQPVNDRTGEGKDADHHKQDEQRVKLYPEAKHVRALSVKRIPAV
jgi:hypothetical protein